MKPEEYFPDLYMEDLKRFLGEHINPEDGGMLCGAVLSAFNNGKVELLSYNDFFCCQYVFNLLNQGIHCYGHLIDNDLSRPQIPFLNVLLCDIAHGGMIRPKGILRHVRLSDELLKEYMCYFFYDYMTSLYGSQKINALVGFLKNDQDCLEVNRYL